MSEAEAEASDPVRTRADDRILLATRVVAVAIVPFLVVAAVILFTLPEQTGDLFAWEIMPPLSAYMLASAYIGGIVFFVRVTLARRWHHVSHGFPAVAVFAGALLVATLLHVDRFSQNLPFVVWLVLYATTPFAIIVLAVVQHPRDPLVPDEGDVMIPRFARVGLAAIGAAALVLGAAMFVAPELFVDAWAWQLTPLTARVTGAVLSLTGVVNAAMLWDARWSAFRMLFQAQLTSLAVIAVSLVAGWEALKWDRPITFVFIGLVAAAIVTYTAFTLWCDARRSSGR